MLGIRLLAFGYVLGTMIYLKQPLKPVNHGTLFSTLLETMEIKEPWDEDALISHFFLCRSLPPPTSNRLILVNVVLPV